MKRFLSVILVLALLVCMIPTALAADLPFKDVESGKWYTNAVSYCYTNDLMNGTSDNKFDPSAKMTRAMLVTVLYRIAGEPAFYGSPFTDVPSGKWYSTAISWAYANGIVLGMTDTTFCPTREITREQMVTIFYRYAEAEGHDVSSSDNLSAFPDASSVSKFASTAVKWAVAEGIINGMKNGDLSPRGTATRAECATIIQRYVEWTKAPQTEKPTNPTESTGPAATEPIPTDPVPTNPIPTEPSPTEPKPTDPVHSHSYIATVTKEASCTDLGIKTFTCSCGDSYSEFIPATGHSYTDEVIAPTCTADGYTIHTCSKCGDHYTDSIVATTGHSYSSVVADPTCTEEGSETFTCSKCGDSYTDVLPVLGHDWEYTHTDEVGHYDVVLVCTCGWSCSESEATAAGYDIGNYWFIQHQGYYQYMGTIGANDHSYTFMNLPEKWIVDTPAFDEWTCSRCELTTQNHDEVTGHKMLRTRYGRGAYCLRGNYSTYTCDTCSYTYDADYIESTGHIFGDWEVTEAVTETSRGWAIRACTECSYSMGDYADKVLAMIASGECYHTFKPESGHVCIVCGEDSVTE